MDALCQFLLCAPTAEIQPIASAKEWLAQRRTPPFARSIERAAAGGFLADRVGYAFAAGYQEALGRLLSAAPHALPALQPVALCATEDGGVHPRAIQTTLTSRSPEDPRAPSVLRGRKRFVSLGALARWLLLIVRRGVDDGGRSQLAAVCIPADRPGIALHAAPETPFVPEIPHASVELREVEVQADEILPGDGYLRYLKPFRTVEDLHVHAAVLGYLIQIARRSGWPQSRIAEALAILCALGPLSDAPPLSPAAHVALAGGIAATARWVADSASLWAQVDAEIAARFARDQRLLSVAGQARSARLESAWRALCAAGESPGSSQLQRID
jgi:alkylation response protein AidB-like acyl-CoA dehydrogenase